MTARSVCTAGPRPQDPFSVAEWAGRTSPARPDPWLGRAARGGGTAQGRSRLRHRGLLGRPNHDLQSLQRRSTLEVPTGRGPCRPGGTSQRWCKTPRLGVWGGSWAGCAGSLPAFQACASDSSTTIRPCSRWSWACTRVSGRPSNWRARRVQHGSKVAGTPAKRSVQAAEDGLRRLLPRVGRRRLGEDDPGVGIVQRDSGGLQRQAGACRPQRRHRIGELLEGLIAVELAIGADW